MMSHNLLLTASRYCRVCRNVRNSRSIFIFGKIWPVSNCSGSKCRKRRVLFTVRYLVFLGSNVWRKISQGKLPFYRGYVIKLTEASLGWESRERYRALFYLMMTKKDLSKQESQWSWFKVGFYDYALSLATLSYS